MPLQICSENEGKVLAVRVEGKLTGEDYERLVPQVEQAIKEHGPLRILFDMHDFHGWTAGAVWKDTKFSLRHFKDIERLAIVGETRWQKGMSVFCRPFTKAQVRYYGREDEAHAMEWLHEGLMAVIP